MSICKVCRICRETRDSEDFKFKKGKNGRKMRSDVCIFCDGSEMEDEYTGRFHNRKYTKQKCRELDKIFNNDKNQ